MRRWASGYSHTSTTRLWTHIVDNRAMWEETCLDIRGQKQHGWGPIQSRETRFSTGPELLMTGGWVRSSGSRAAFISKRCSHFRCTGTLTIGLRLDGDHRRYKCASEVTATGMCTQIDIYINVHTEERIRSPGVFPHAVSLFHISLLHFCICVFKWSLWRFHKHWYIHWFCWCSEDRFQFTWPE